MPTTFCCGRPQDFCSAQTIASSGLVMQMTNAFGAYFLMPAPTWLHDLEIDVEQVVAAHAGLARHAGGDDADVGAFDGFVLLVPVNLASKSLTGEDCGDIERLALRDAFHDVEQDDVAELLEANEVGQRAADLAGADQRNLVTRHGGKTLEL